LVFQSYAINHAAIVHNWYSHGAEWSPAVTRLFGVFCSLCGVESCSNAIIWCLHFVGAAVVAPNRAGIIHSLVSYRSRTWEGKSERKEGKPVVAFLPTRTNLPVFSDQLFVFWPLQDSSLFILKGQHGGCILF
jgi:hypothetical protein